MRLPLLTCLSLLTLASPAVAQSFDALHQRTEADRAARGSIPNGTFTSIHYLLDVAERIAPRYEEQSEAWKTRAVQFLDSVEQGRDPYPQGRGQILNRGYQPTFTPTRQGYAIYLPPDYDP